MRFIDIFAGIGGFCSGLEKAGHQCVGYVEGDVVLDPFMGSGSTGESAIVQGRKFVGVEINDDYFETAKNRLTLLI